MSEHTNCWCEPNVIRCSLPDCPRRPRYFAKQKRQQEWSALMSKLQGEISGKTQSSG